MNQLRESTFVSRKCSLARVPTDGEIFLREIGRQTAFNFCKVAGTRYARSWINLPGARIVEGKIEIVFGKFAVEVSVCVG